MLPAERRLRIIDALGARGLVRVDDLVAELNVSAETIRRDLIELEKRGELTRVYGGATRVGEAAETPRRDVANPDAKRAIARLAASLVKPHQTLIFDVGTTVTETARALPSDLPGQVLTNSLFTAQELSRRPNLQIHLAGGELRTEDLACSGPETEQFFDGFYADIAFLCAGGVHPQAGITDFFPREIAVRRHMLQRSNEQYVLADSTKLGRVALRRVCEVAGVTAIITDADAPQDAVDALTARGVQVLIAGEPEAAEEPEPAQLPIPESPLLDLDGPPQAFAFDGN